MPHLRIFISSPGDVAEERKKACQVVEQLQRFYGERLTLETVVWEDLPLQADCSFQEGIDFLLEEKRGIDIAVFILWSRLGSPLGAAIRKPDGSEYLSGTEREFDLMISAREKSGGRRPSLLAYVRDDVRTFQKALENKTTSDMEQMIRQRKLAEGFIRENFHDEEGHNLRAYHTFQEPVGFARRLRVHLRDLIDELAGEADARLVGWTGSPYRGLEVFESEHAPIFFGREQEVYAIETRLRERSQAGCGFLVVVGASGSGKSSLVRAGVVANQIQSNLEDTFGRWVASVMVPGGHEGDLILPLARALVTACPVLAPREDALREGLRRDPDLALRLVVDPVLAPGEGREPRTGWLLLIDQLEELVSDTSIAGAERALFWQVLQVLVTHPCIRIIATLRSDFFPLLQREEGFLALKGKDGHFDLLPPATSALHRIIREPARLAGLAFERLENGRTLDEEILEHIKTHPEALPLLEYALHELYERREGERLLTYEAFRAIGGVDGALGRRAETVFQNFPGPVREAFSRVFHALVTVGEEGATAGARRRALLSSWSGDPDAREMVEAFIRQRFFVVDQEGTEAVVSIAHEALLRSWPRLSGWVEANLGFLRMRSHVEAAWQRWRESGADPSLLLAPGLPLEEGRAVLNNGTDPADSEVRQYIESSLLAEERRLHRLSRRRKLMLGGLGVVALFMGLLALLAWHQTGQAETALALAEQERARAEVRQREAEERQNQVLGLLESLVYELPFPFRRLGQLDLLDGLHDPVEGFLQDPGLGLDSAREIRLQFWFRFLQAELSLGRGRFYHAVGLARESLALAIHPLLLEEEPWLQVYAHQLIGRLLQELGDTEQAVESLSESIEVLTFLTKEGQGTPDLTGQLIQSLAQRGARFLEMRQNRAAEEDFRRAFALVQELQAEALAETDLPGLITPVVYQLAESYFQVGLYDRAHAEVDRLLDYLGRRTEPSVPWAKNLFRGMQSNYLLETGASHESIPLLVAVLGEARSYLQENTLDLNRHRDLLAVLDRSFRAYLQSGQYTRAAEILAEADALWVSAPGRGTGNFFWEWVRPVLDYRGHLLHEGRREWEAITASLPGTIQQYESLIQADDGRPVTWFEDQHALRFLLGRAYWHTGDSTRALEELGKAVGHIATLRELLPHNVHHLAAFGHSLVWQGKILRAMGEHESSGEILQRGLKELQNLQESGRALPNHRAWLALAWREWARWLQESSNPTGAAVAYLEAMGFFLELLQLDNERIDWTEDYFETVLLYAEVPGAVAQTGVSFEQLRQGLEDQLRGYLGRFPESARGAYFQDRITAFGIRE